MIVRRIPAGGVAGCACGGVGCTCGGTCDSCAAGVGDTTVATEPTVMEKIWSALTTQLPIGGTGIPVWLLVGAGLVAAATLMPGKQDYRRYRR
jgi:hypothetical protein